MCGCVYVFVCECFYQYIKTCTFTSKCIADTCILMYCIAFKT